VCVFAHGAVGPPAACAWRRLLTLATALLVVERACKGAGCAEQMATHQNVTWLLEGAQSLAMLVRRRCGTQRIFNSL
jgi:hypothetical protein